MLKRIYLPLHLQARKCVAAVEKEAEYPPFKARVVLDEKIKDLILKDELKPRKQPGTCYKITTFLPEWYINATRQLMKDRPIKTIKEDARTLQRYLLNRRLPYETHESRAKYEEIKESLKSDPKYADLVTKDMGEIKRIAQKTLKAKLYNWQPIEYNHPKCMMYLVGRGPHDYTILYTIFSEIKKRDPKFRPTTLFDFGSGVGSVAWAAGEFWSNSIVEYLGVDVSKSMTNLAEWLAERAKPPLKNMFFKHYFPVTSPPYDIVVSAFTLFELPNRKTRLDNILNLWKKTKKYLVLVEEGTNAGFSLITEARNFITHLLKVHKEKGYYTGYVFAPCPHELGCPRLTFDQTPCNFEASFITWPFMKFGRPIKTRYSYIIFKKDDDRPEEDAWPKIVRPVIVRSKLAICRMCTEEGKLQEIIFSKAKYEQPLFRCARSSDWGDRLPIKIFNDAEGIENSERQINCQVDDNELELDNQGNDNESEINDDQSELNNQVNSNEFETNDEVSDKSKESQ